MKQPTDSTWNKIFNFWQIRFQNNWTLYLEISPLCIPNSPPTPTATSFLHVLSWFCTFHMQMLHFPMIESTHLYPLPIIPSLLLLIRSIYVCSIPDWNAHVHVICCGHLNLAWYGLLLSRLGTILKKQSAHDTRYFFISHNFYELRNVSKKQFRNNEVLVFAIYRAFNLIGPTAIT